MKQLKSYDLRKWTDEGRDFLLVDIRDLWEREENNIGGVHIPMDELIGRIAEIPKDIDVVFYCERGIRSVIVIQRLEGWGYQNLYNLSGGIRAWQESFSSPS